MLHLDHHKNLSNIKIKIEEGIRSIMVDASQYPFKEDIDIVSKMVVFSHKYNTTIEAELDLLGDQKDDFVVDNIEKKTYLLLLMQPKDM